MSTESHDEREWRLRRRFKGAPWRVDLARHPGRENEHVATVVPKSRLTTERQARLEAERDFKDATRREQEWEKECESTEAIAERYTTHLENARKALAAIPPDEYEDDRRDDELTVLRRLFAALGDTR